MQRHHEHTTKARHCDTAEWSGHTEHYKMHATPANLLAHRFETHSQWETLFILSLSLTQHARKLLSDWLCLSQPECGRTMQAITASQPQHITTWPTQPPVSTQTGTDTLCVSIHHTQIHKCVNDGPGLMSSASQNCQPGSSTNACVYRHTYTHTLSVSIHTQAHAYKHRISVNQL